MKYKNFIAEFLETLPPIKRRQYKKKKYDVWDFGSNAKVSKRGVKLVKTGNKKAGAVFYDRRKRLPKVGDLGIITDHKGEPQCLIEYTSIKILPFKKISFEFADAEGEGYKNIEAWKKEHFKYFRSMSKNFNENSPILCERFKLLFKK